MGCICAAGASPATALDALEKGERRWKCGMELGEHALPLPFFAVHEANDETADGCFARGRRFSALDTMELALKAGRDALHQAALPEPALAGMGVVLGTTAGSALHFLRDYATRRTAVTGSGAPFAPPMPTRGDGAGLHDFADYAAANLALGLAQRLLAGTVGENCCGPRLTVTNACTSGADALGLGLDLIRQGADCVLCGGADALSLVPHSGFARLMIYADELCRPFDRCRTGLNLGEGAALLVLESPEHAARRGAPVLGRVLGYGAASDAHHFTAPHPEGRGLAAAIDMALHEADTTLGGNTAQELAFINAHATSTPDNDKVEGRLLRRLFPHTPVWASKGCTGHTLGAAGALEAIFAVEALRRGRVPASWGFAEVDPDMGLCPTTATLSLTSCRALSTSLGFGGGNAALVLEGVRS